MDDVDPAIGIELRLTGLRVALRPLPSRFDRWFNSVVEVDPRPFGGTLSTTFMLTDLESFVRQLERFDPTGTAMLGGGRAAEVRVTARHQLGAEPDDETGLVTAEVSVTANGDDPFPSLSIRALDQEPFGGRWAREVAALVLAARDHWPTP